MAIDISSMTNTTLQKTTHNERNTGVRNDKTTPDDRPQASTSINVDSAVQRVQDMIYEATGIDNEKVSRIKQMIIDGSYTPDAERIAEKMMNFEYALVR